ncbi:alpha-amylase family glycosyl hydrolase [Paractinoplanes brasiliensis]|uniref:Glycosidase n=1 Tax=Paractinoplanes brasiliensis TaxID=52695 RepID=A0A4R6J858_9ACTN|nr:alpha-amylase family glycosyl hydrolase [Actinoplanes brasiliensis]TDO31729.1 glycosidase [Actinoplanes brasiliensis]GID30678.1 alpha-amylase [Actinoplanes brasiliensis]
MSSWVGHAVWWHVYPLGFGRLDKIAGWLDYEVELGANGLQLGPLFASETHGYDTIDHFRVDPRLGDDADFDALIAAARQRGVRVLLDGVFNHVGRGFQAPAHWFTGGSFEGHDSLRELDHTQPEVLDHVVRVMDHWLSRGADGWRLDAAYAVDPKFWKAALDRVRPLHPDAWFVGEVIHGDYAAVLRDSGLDAITQYELWKAIWSSLNDGNFYELAHALQRHGELLPAGLPMTFLGNHDVTRIASKLDDPRHLGHAVAILCTVAGVPSIYYGDEQAFRGVKEEREGGDDEIRPAFPGSPSELSPLGWPTYRLHERLIGLRRRHPEITYAVTTATHLTNTAAAFTSGPVTLLLNVADSDYRFPDVPPEAQVLESSSPVSGDPAVVPAHGWSVVTR